MLDGKVAIITGATSGIGTRTAELFVEEGASIVFTGRRAPEGEALQKRLGEHALFIRADATVEPDWERVVAETLRAFGRLDCLLTACSTMPAARPPPAASRPSRSRASTPRWHCWCAPSCSA
jgi:NAD(P)-dependent dehydrogenase (short-subunit alcohol dehydrogenase family)